MDKIVPVKGNYIISQGWNVWNPKFYGARWEFRHKGIDYAPIGGAASEIVAIQDGVVTFAGWNGTQTTGWGRLVTINHGEFESWSAHMSAIEVKVGQVVKQGDTIGRVGSTGLSTGPHLHLGVKDKGVWVDPSNYLDIKQEEEEMDESLWMNVDGGEIYRIWNPTATFLRWNAGNSSDPERYLLSRQIPSNHWVKKDKIAEITRGKKEVTKLSEMS